ncbi:MAG: glutamine synthetase type III, partial [Bacilli bacterium]|nr:glutamine synthetase type III [Bacilli bacterium]
ETHYFGHIPEKVQAFMSEVNEELWALGVYAKTEHNEVAPGQFELAPIYANCNVAVDQNQLIMEVLQKVAMKHDLVCLLHEKPFKGVNGSGKHNNYSLVTNTGVNVFDPGKNPHENIQFLTFVCAFIKALDTHPELIRMYSSCPGNDYRLGANEAPPAVISIFLGDAIERTLNQLVNDKPKTYEKSALKDFGISNLSYLPSDNSDRNRTSPVAFTGNKFEVRALGSSMSAGNLNIALNTMMADALNEIADEMEAHKYRQDIRKAAIDVCVEIMEKHNRILFSGDGYASSWVPEAEKRGLLNLKTWVESIAYVDEHNSGEIFIKNGILSKEEFAARLDVMYESYYKVKSIELSTLCDMMRTKIFPMVNRNIAAYTSAGEFAPSYLKETAKELISFIDDTATNVKALEDELKSIKSLSSYKEKSLSLLKKCISLQEKIRGAYDTIEGKLDTTLFFYPKYRELFFRLDF